ncbi:MAG: SRPBCC family protein [Thermoplasmata archaeon]|nr:SRPBCC family protein [Thermoplasmata archaeon]
MNESPLPKRVESSIVVNARPERVFPLLENPYSLPNWITYLRQVEWARGSGLGSLDGCHLRIAGIKFHATARVHAFEKNVQIGRTNVEGMKMRSEFHLVPDGSRTIVTWAVSYEPPLGQLGFLLDAMMFHRVIRKGVAASLHELKRVAEAGHGRFWTPSRGHAGATIGERDPTVHGYADVRGNRSRSDHPGRMEVSFRA